MYFSSLGDCEVNIISHLKWEDVGRGDVVVVPCCHFPHFPFMLVPCSIEFLGSLVIWFIKPLRYHGIFVIKISWSCCHRKINPLIFGFKRRKICSKCLSWSSFFYLFDFKFSLQAQVRAGHVQPKSLPTTS